MITTAILSLLALVPGHAGSLEPAESAAPQTTLGDEVEVAIRSAGTSVAALLELAAGYEKASKAAAAKRVFERVIELDPGNELARKQLRHQRYDERWFESYVELARYKREETARMNEKGLARWKKDWVPQDDLPFLRMGWVRDAHQTWSNPAEMARALEVEEWKAAGYQFRADDNSWIAPEDFEHWTALKWKCADQWLDLKAANGFHSKPETPWELAGEHFQVLTTCDWSYGNSARWHADHVHAELVRLFGVAPSKRPQVLLLGSLDEYNTAAAGLMFDAEGLSSLHGAYFADGAVDTSQEPNKYLGVGVSYWESGDAQVAGWGPFWLRWAAAQSFVDAIDPSWGAVSLLVINSGDFNPQVHGKQFWSEKCIPRWLRYGAASYVERYLANPEAAEGADPWDLRNFALAELKKDGGLRDLSKIFAFELTLDDMPDSAKLYSEAGLLVSFLLDGCPDDAELRSTHEAFRVALATGSKDGVRAAAKSLESALAERSRAIRAYAGL